jgi:outer membrane receptor protein involved in Fe transport
MDHSFNENNRLFGRVNHYAYEIPKNALGIPASTFVQHQINEGAALDDVIVLSPSLILNLRYGFTTAQFPEFRATKGTDLATLGFSPALTSLLDPTLSTVPRVAMSPFTTLSNWSSGDGTNTSVYHDWVADVTKLRGQHSFRFGADLRVMRTFGNRYQAAIAPDFSFSTTYTQGPLDNAAAAPVGQQMAALLMGIPGGSMTVPANSSYAVQDKYLGLYIQDDLKLTTRLTLNLGLRYEIEWPVTERYNRLVSGFAYDTSNPIEVQAKANYAKSPIPELPVSAFSARGGLLWANQHGTGRSPYSTNSGQWLPRIGLAWQLSPKTVLRTGYGIYFGSLGVDTFVPVQTGFSQTTPIQASLDNGQTYVATVANPFPKGLIAPTGGSGGLTTSLGQAISFFNPNLNPPYSQRWSFGIQRQLPGAFLLDASYVGNRTTHIAVTQQINNTPAQYLSTSPARDQNAINYLTQQFPNPFFALNSVFTANTSRASLLQPYPEFGNITVLQPQGYSWYHSLQIKLERRLLKGFTLQVGYTHSKFMQATEYLNPTDPTPYRVISDMDRPNLFTVSGLWEVPVGRGRRFGSNLPRALNFVIGNWQLDGSEVHQSGAPLSWGNIIFNGDLHSIPLAGSQTTVDRWFNVDAGFNRNSAQQLANNIRTFPLRLSGVRGDGQTIVNFSLLRNYTIIERVKAQFRAEVYNAFNHPVFDLPNTTPTSSAFGTVTQSISEPRGIQLALKIVF